MSIIVDALHKLQESKNISGFTQSEMHLFDELKKINRGSGNRLKLVGIFILVFAILFNLYIFNSDDSLVEEASIGVNPIQLASESIQSQDNASSQTDPIQKTIEVDPVVTTPETNIPATEEVPVASISEKLEETTSPTSNTQELVTAPVETIAQEQKIETVAPPAIDTPTQIPVIEQVVPESKPEPIPEWVLKGIEQFNSGSFEKAQIIWNKGFSKLDENTQLFSVMINYNPELAREMINNLIQKNFSVFTLTAMFRSKRAYYTMVLPEQSALETTKETLHSQFTIDPYMIDKQSMQRRIDALKKVKPIKSSTVASVDIESILVKAEKAVYQGNYDDVLTLLNPHLKQNPKNWKLLFWLGSAELGLQNYQRADNLFLKAQAINPDLPQVWTQRAIIAQERNDHTSALQFLAKAKALAPKTPEIALNIAYSYEAIGDKNGAVYSYREFLNLSKDRRGYEDLRQSAEIRLNDLIYQ